MDKSQADLIVCKNAICCELFSILTIPSVIAWQRKEIKHFIQQPCYFKLIAEKGKTYVVLNNSAYTYAKSYSKLGFYDGKGKAHPYVLDNDKAKEFFQLLDKPICLLQGVMWKDNVETPLMLKLKAYLLDIVLENSKHGISYHRMKFELPFEPKEKQIAWDLGTYPIQDEVKEMLIERLVSFK